MTSCLSPVLPIQASALKVSEPTDRRVWKVVAEEIVPFSSDIHLVPRGDEEGGSKTG